MRIASLAAGGAPSLGVIAWEGIVSLGRWLKSGSA